MASGHSGGEERATAESGMRRGERCGSERGTRQALRTAWKTATARGGLERSEGRCEMTVGRRVSESVAGSSET